MSFFQFRCDHCGRSLYASPEAVGRTRTCIHCKNSVIVPAPQPDKPSRPARAKTPELAVDRGSAESLWYYVRNGVRVGPVSLSVLREMAAAAQLDPDDRVWTSEMADWVYAGQIDGLFARQASYSEASEEYADAAAEPWADSDNAGDLRDDATAGLDALATAMGERRPGGSSRTSVLRQLTRHPAATSAQTMVWGYRAALLVAFIGIACPWYSVNASMSYGGVFGSKGYSAREVLRGVQTAWGMLGVLATLGGIGVSFAAPSLGTDAVARGILAGIGGAVLVAVGAGYLFMPTFLAEAMDISVSGFGASGRASAGVAYGWWITILGALVAAAVGGTTTWVQPKRASMSRASHGGAR